MAKRTLPLNKRGFNFESQMWIFTRLSALGMYLFILIGIIGALVMGARTQMNMADVIRWGIMPQISHVVNTNVTDTVLWESILWKLTGSALVLLAVSHGVHGLVVIADDYIASKLGRQIVRLISMVAMASFTFIALYIVWK
jgi:succinate dehydrogenase hydrophobic anchor subunit